EEHGEDFAVERDEAISSIGGLLRKAIAYYQPNFPRNDGEQKTKMNLDKIHSIYFIGIGGIGMSALARYFNVNGKKISGYDRTPSSLTDELINEGMQIHFTEDVELIPKDVDLVAYTPAIPLDHKE